MIHESACQAACSTGGCKGGRILLQLVHAHSSLTWMMVCLTEFFERRNFLAERMVGAEIRDCILTPVGLFTRIHIFNKYMQNRVE